MQVVPEKSDLASAAVVVRAFLDEVRSGRDLDATVRYMAPMVTSPSGHFRRGGHRAAHPADYADNVREFQATFDQFSFGRWGKEDVSLLGFERLLCDREPSSSLPYDEHLVVRVAVKHRPGPDAII